jgi:hypothetical protein
MAKKEGSGGQPNDQTKNQIPKEEDPFKLIANLRLSGRSVKQLAARRCTKAEIALILGTTVERINERFSAEYDAGVALFKGVLRGAQTTAAAKGSVPMQIWLGKNHLGQTDSGETPEAGEQQTTLVEIYDASDPAAVAATDDEQMPDRLP